MTKQEQITIQSLMELLAAAMELKAENAALKAENELLKKILDKPTVVISGKDLG